MEELNMLSKEDIGKGFMDSYAKLVTEPTPFILEEYTLLSGQLRACMMESMMRIRENAFWTRGIDPNIQGVDSDDAIIATIESMAHSFFLNGISLMDCIIFLRYNIEGKIPSSLDVVSFAITFHELRQQLMAHGKKEDGQGGNTR
jgi:hypothetical protein